MGPSGDPGSGADDDSTAPSELGASGIPVVRAQVTARPRSLSLGLSGTWEGAGGTGIATSGATSIFWDRGFGGFGGRSGQDHFRQPAFGEFRRRGVAPSLRAFAAEAAIGQQAKGGLDPIAPALAGSFIGEGNQGPQAGAGAKFQARHGVPLAKAGEPVYGSVKAQAGTERTGLAGRQQALAGAIDAPRRIHSAARAASSDGIRLSGTKRALFQRTREDSSAGDEGGHKVRGGTTRFTSSTNGKQELNATAATLRRAVASSHSSNAPSRSMAAETAPYSESL
jgi:hypothetical protein